MMKRYSIILYIVAIITIVACQDEKQPAQVGGNTGKAITFDTLQINRRILLDSVGQNSPALSVNINLLIPSNAAPAIADNINNCIAYTAFDIEATKATAAADSIVKILAEEYLGQRDSYINEKNADPYMPWYNNYYLLNSRVSEGLNNCICYTVDYEIYCGGAHPNSIESNVNIDKETGKEIVLTDIFIEGAEEALTGKLLERLAQQNGVKGIAELQEIGYLNFGDMFVSNNFVLGKDSITFIYNNYEIAPYALGRSHIGLKYEDIKGLLRTATK